MQTQHLTKSPMPLRESVRINYRVVCVQYIIDTQHRQKLHNKLEVEEPSLPENHAQLCVLLSKVLLESSHCSAAGMQKGEMYGLVAVLARVSGRNAEMHQGCSLITARKKHRKYANRKCQ